MPKPRRLKVFTASLGFYETVVAVPSRAAALRAWGSHQDLFASGLARETQDPELTAAALAQPDIVLKRAVGSSDRFAVEAISLPKVPRRQKPAPVKTMPKPASKPPQPRKPADRRALDAAESKLANVDAARKCEEADLRDRQAALEAERRKAQTAYVEARKAATAAVVEARKAYRDAGGAD
ncbi:hypothetical protein D3C80_1313800 [compost metagenome]